MLLLECLVSWLLYLDVVVGMFDDCMFCELFDFLCLGDLLVFNDICVLLVWLYGCKDIGGVVEILIEWVIGVYEVVV